MDRLRICSVGRWDVQDCGAKIPPYRIYEQEDKLQIFARTDAEGVL